MLIVNSVREKVSDGMHVFPITTVAAKNLSGINNYQYTDNDLSSNNNEVFYRLKFIDTNGRLSRYSKRDSVTFNQF